MKVKSKLALYALLIVGCALINYLTWSSIRPVEIIAVHKRSTSFISVIVRNFPLTDRDKIAWWLKNKAMFEEEYNIPNPENNGYFYLTFWLFGDGYKEEGKYDRLCFDDMETKVNCIEKDAVFSVKNSKNMGTIFKTYDGTYRLQNDGEVAKYVDHSEIW